jgi:ABC-type glycerol-3-phosphate transport system substrate-binding protein
MEVDGAMGRHIYALPEDNAQFGLFYNKAIFDAYNREHPGAPLAYPSEAWTWGDLRRTAQTLTTYDASGRITRAGFDFAIWAWPFMMFFVQAGGELWSADGKTCTVNSPAGVEALEFLRSMQREDRSFQPSLSGYQSGTGPDALFAAGRTAMFMDGSWRVPNFEGVAPDLDFAVAPLPRGRRAAVVSGSVMWGISADAKEKDEGWRMISWLTDVPRQLEYWDTLRVAPPASLAALASPAFRSTSGLPLLGADGTVIPGRWEVPPMPESRFADRAAWLLYANKPLPETGKAPGFVPVHPYETELEEEINRMLNEYLNPRSTLTAEEALESVVRHVEAVMGRER